MLANVVVKRTSVLRLENLGLSLGFVTHRQCVSRQVMYLLLLSMMVSQLVRLVDGVPVS